MTELAHRSPKHCPNEKRGAKNPSAPPGGNGEGGGEDLQDCEGNHQADREIAFEGLLDGPIAATQNLWVP